MGLFERDLEKIVAGMIRDIRTVPLNPQKTVVINLDTVEGFFRNGAMASDRLASVIPEIVQVNEYFMSARKLFLLDSHTDSSTEFKSYPLHCTDDAECEILSELEPFAVGVNCDILTKNSVNPFVCSGFIRWLTKNSDQLSNYVIVGGFTDTSVLQFSLTLRSYFNENDILKKRVVVVENAVQTFDSDSHNGDKMHLFALYNMLINGVSVVRV